MIFGLGFGLDGMLICSGTMYAGFVGFGVRSLLCIVSERLYSYYSIAMLATLGSTTLQTFS